MQFRIHKGLQFLLQDGCLLLFRSASSLGHQSESTRLSRVHAGLRSGYFRNTHVIFNPTLKETNFSNSRATNRCMAFPLRRAHASTHSIERTMPFGYRRWTSKNSNRPSLRIWALKRPLPRDVIMIASITYKGITKGVSGENDIAT